MKRQTQIIVFLLSAAVVLSCVALGVFFSVRNREEFTGNRIKNSDCYRLEILYMNGSDRHTLQFEAGDTLQVHFQTEEGTLTLEIQSPSGTPIYTGNGRGVADFTLNISESGTYTVLVQARQAKGQISLQRG